MSSPSWNEIIDRPTFFGYPLVFPEISLALSPDAGVASFVQSRTFAADNHNFIAINIGAGAILPTNSLLATPRNRE